MTRFAIGVDLGGTNLKLGAIHETGELLDHVQFPADTEAGRDDVVDRLCRAIVELTERWEKRHQLAGIGVGIAGIMKLEEGLVIAAPNLPGWKGFPIRSQIEKKLNVPFVLENDANAAALGEKWMGVGQEIENFAFLTLGTGIGGGLILNGKIWHGMSGMAGELGHVNIRPEGRLCNCGSHGCLESYASATAVVRSTKELVESGRASQELRSLVESNKILKADAVYRLAKSGDTSSMFVFGEMGRALGIAIAGFVHILDIESVILGGGAIAAWDVFQQAMFEEVHRDSFIHKVDPRQIIRSSLGSQAGIFGAAYLGFQS